MNTKQKALKKANEIADLHYFKYDNLVMATGLLHYLENAIDEYFETERHSDGD